MIPALQLLIDVAVWPLWAVAIVSLVVAVRACCTHFTSPS